MGTGASHTTQVKEIKRANPHDEDDDRIEKVKAASGEKAKGPNPDDISAKPMQRKDDAVFADIRGKLGREQKQELRKRFERKLRASDDEETISGEASRSLIEVWFAADSQDSATVLVFLSKDANRLAERYRWDEFLALFERVLLHCETRRAKSAGSRQQAADVPRQGLSKRKELPPLSRPFTVPETSLPGSL